MLHTDADLAQVLHTGPFHLALRAALAVRGLPLQRVQHHLAGRGVKVGVTSLSYWQQGARRPQRAESLRAVRALEEVLGLPDRSLLRLLDDGDAREAERPAGRSYRSLVEASGVVERLITGLESPVDGGLHTVGHQERVRVGAHREMLGRDSQQVVRAHRDGVDRYLAIHHGDPGCDPSRVRVRAAENCRTGRVRWDAETGVLVAELLFDARLRAERDVPLRLRLRGRHGGPEQRVRTRLQLRGRAVRAPGPLRRAGPAGAVPPLRPDVGLRGPLGPGRPDAERAAPDRAPGRAGGAAGDPGDRLGLGVRGALRT